MTRELQLTKGLVAIVDDCDYDLVSQWKWSAAAGKYAARRYRKDGGQRMVYLHRAVMNAREGERVDHIDGNPLNNTRSNLRFSTQSQNMANKAKTRSPCSSRHKGVWKAKTAGKWHARCNREYLGTFVSEDLAAAAYEASAIRQYGEFARTDYVEMAA